MSAIFGHGHLGQWVGSHIVVVVAGCHSWF
jgi:hypothetical protein